MKRLPALDVLIRQWLHNPHAITVAAFVITGIFLWIADWLIHRNLRHNEPGLRATRVAVRFSYCESQEKAQLRAPDRSKAIS